MSKKYDALAKNLSKIVADAYELGWKSLIITDQERNPKGVVCGPSEFIDDFKMFTEDMKHIEKDLEKFVEQNNLDNNGDIPDIKNDDDDGGKTWH